MAVSRRFNLDCSDRALMYAAARVIEVTCRELKTTHALNGRWAIWCDSDRVAKASYDHDMLLVRELRARARMAE